MNFVDVLILIAVFGVCLVAAKIQIFGKNKCKNCKNKSEDCKM